MFEISFLLVLKVLIVNVFVPLLSGILFLWIFFGDKFKGWILYIVSFFIGTGVIAFSLFNLQFFYFGIGIGEYVSLNLLLAILLFGKILLKKEKVIMYLKTLQISFPFSDVRSSYHSLRRSEHLLFILGSIFIFFYTLISFFFSISFPSYADDTFSNWNNPAINIYYDDGVKILGENNEILGRGRLGYPIYIPIYKALISDFIGTFNDIYINLWQTLGLYFFLIFMCIVTFQKTKNIFYSILPIVLIYSLPLIFFHATEGYLDLPSAIYSALFIYFVYSFLETDDFDFLALGLLFGFMLAHIKNDGIIIYFSGIILGFLVFLLFTKKFLSFCKKIIHTRVFLFKILFFILFFFLPFILLKSYLGLGYNQAAGGEGGLGLSIHNEIFRVFPPIFRDMDNFNISLVILGLMIFTVMRFPSNKKNLSNSFFLFLSFLCIFSLFIAVFLFTSNYQWALDQTTINRVFTMSFVILFSFTGFLFHEKNN